MKFFSVNYDKNYNRVISRIKGIDDLAKEAVKRIPKRIAGVFVEKLQVNWELKTEKYPDLSESWLATKRRLGLDENIWLATHTLIENVITEKIKGGLFVTLADKQHPLSGILTLREVAATVEFGRLDKSQPPRPLWYDTIQETLAEVDTIMREEIRDLQKKFLGR